MDAEKFLEMDAAEIDALSPLEKIQLMASANKIDIKDPKPNCKKCYGRGYTGLMAETKAPIFCTCLFRGQKANNQQAEKDFKNMSREEIRKNPTYMKFYKELRTNNRVKRLKQINGEVDATTVDQSKDANAN